LTRNIDGKRVIDSRKCSTRNSEGMAMDREDNDECFQECKVGSKDISDLVKSAVRAAEAEARAAAAPMEAVKAAGDAAAELVKSAAMDVITSREHSFQKIKFSSLPFFSISLLN